MPIEGRAGAGDRVAVARPLPQSAQDESGHTLLIGDGGALDG